MRRIVVAHRLETGQVFVDRLLGADQFVNVASLVCGLGVAVLAALVVRWALVARGNEPVLGEPALPFAGGLRAWWLGWPLALLLFAVSRLGLGEAETPTDRERLDAYGIVATLALAAAAAATIVVVDRVTAAQGRRARALDAPLARRDRPRKAGDESSLVVVTEREATARGQDSNRRGDDGFEGA